MSNRLLRCGGRCRSQGRARIVAADAERIQRAALRDVVQTRRLGHRRGADRTELVGQIQACGDGQTDPAPDTTDSIMALDLKTGKTLWFYQAQAGDAFMGGCNGDMRTDNCPKENGPDQDIGNSPILRKLADGKSVIAVL